MIKDDQEYENTKYLAEEFKKTVAAMERSGRKKKARLPKMADGARCSTVSS
jgi:hypothetical protein